MPALASGEATASLPPGGARWPHRWAGKMLAPGVRKRRYPALGGRLYRHRCLCRPREDLAPPGRGGGDAPRGDGLGRGGISRGPSAGKGVRQTFQAAAGCSARFACSAARGSGLSGPPPGGEARNSLTRLGDVGEARARRALVHPLHAPRGCLPAT